MENNIETEQINRIKKTIISLCSTIFELILTLRDNRKDEDNFNLENEIELILHKNYIPTHSNYSGTILSIIRELDSIKDKISKEQKTWKNLYDQYNYFVDSQTSKQIDNKDKRYQIASDFFSFVASMILMQKRDTENYIDNLESISSRLFNIETELSSERLDDRQKKINDIVKFISSLEKTMGNLIKILEIQPSEILHPKSQGDSDI